MRKVLLLLIVSLISNLIFGDSKSIRDSLLTVIDESEDIEKVEAYCSYIDYITDRNHHQKEVLNYLKLAKILAEKINDKNEICNVLESYSKYYFYKSEYEKAIKYSLDAINIAETEKNNEQLVALYYNTANIFFNIGNTFKTKEYYTKSIEINKSVGNIRISIMNQILIGNTFFKENIDSAEFYYIRALNTYIDNKSTYKDPSSEFLIYGSLGDLYLEQGKYEKALEYLYKAMDLSGQSTKDIRFKAFSLLNISKVQIEQKKYEDAFENVEKGIKMSTEIGAKEVEIEAYLLLSDLYKLTNNYENALLYYEKSNRLKDSLRGNEKNQRIAELETKFKTDKQEQEFEFRKKEDDLIAQRNYIILGGLLLVLLFIILILNQRRKNLSKSKLISENKKDLAVLKYENAQTRLENKNLELEHFSNQLQAKNKLIEKIENDIVNIIAEKNEKSEKIAKEELINLKILSDEDWLRFKILFEEVYQGFLSLIEEKFPDLTEGDKRQIILLKLNMSVQHSADTLGVSQQAIWRARKRLSDKIGLVDSKELKRNIEDL